MKSILLIGQSNMAGRGFIKDVPKIINEQIKVLRNGRWQMMGEPIHADRHLAGVGLASAFAQSYVIDHPDETIGLIPCAEGGSAIEEWAPGSVLMRHALSEAQFAKETSDIIAILWHQGENDSRDDLYKSYQAQIETLIDHVRQSLNIEDVPFIIGGLDHLNPTQGLSLNLTQHQNINHILQQMPKVKAQTYFVTSQGLTMNPDGIHIDAKSLRIFGVRYYEAFLKHTSINQPLTDEAKRIEALYQRPHTQSERIYLEFEKLATGQTTFEAFSKAMNGN